MVSEPSYISLLRNEFTRRKAKNVSYSLSAFAKQLEIDQSLFSKILSGKKRISDRLAADLLARSGVSRDRIAIALTGFAPVVEDEFEFLSSWIPFAILELIKTETFDPSVKSIARRLKVHGEEVTAAIKLLERFGYIEVSKAGGFILKKPNNEWSNNLQSSRARKQLQKTYAEMSLAAIDDVPFKDRDHGSLTIAIDTNRMPEIKEFLSRVRRELSDFLQDSSELNEVYQLTLSIFPLTKLGEDND